MAKRVDQNRNLKKIEEIVIETETGQNKTAPNVYEVQNEINKVKQNWIRLFILVWNAQSLNNDFTERTNKEAFIKDMIAKINPEIIFIMDLGKRANSFNVVNYRITSDGRNILAVRNDIKNNVTMEDGVFRMKEIDLNFAYVRPAETKEELKKKVMELLRQDKAVIGDLNIRSNKFLSKEIEGKNILGEPTEQIVMIKKNLKKSVCEIYLAPSDHKAVVYEAKRRVKHSSQLKLETMTIKNCEEAIKSIFEMSKFKISCLISPIKKIMPFNEEKIICDNILDEYINNSYQGVFKRFSYLWKGFKKEPFLGTYIPQSVEDSLKGHYRHDDLKIYKEIPKGEVEVSLLRTRQPSHSNAANNEKFRLCDIDKSLDKIWHELLKDNKTQEAIANFITFCNNNKEDLCYTTFFLKKNAQLLSFNDIRIISIVPIHVKIWENLIYDSVVSYLTHIIDNEGLYQFGGKPGGSTYDALFWARELYQKNKGKGILFLDLAKGYDSVNWNILEQDIQQLEDPKIVRILQIWLILINNTDALANNNRICKTRGVGMGLALAPIIFEFYVHRAIIKTDINIQNLVMYVDDLAIILEEPNDIENFKELKKNFEDRELLLNIKKSCVLTVDKEIEEACKKIQIEKKDIEKYLGICLGINNHNDIVVDDRYLKLSDMFTCIPRMICYAIKKRIIEGAIIAKTRYSCMMFSLKSNLEKKKIIQYIWKNFKKDFYKLSYIQLILFMFNWCRFVIDLNDLQYIKEQAEQEEDSELYALDLIKAKLKCGIPQWDEVVDEMKQIDILVCLWQINLFGVKQITKKIWKRFKEAAIEVWKKKKIQEGRIISAEIVTIMQSKLFQNSKIIQSIILRHLDNNNYDFVMFIVMVIKQMTERFQSEKTIVEEFKLIDIMTIDMKVQDNKDLINKYFNMLYEFLDDCIKKLMMSHNKTVERDIFKIMIMLDEISSYSASYKMPVCDLIYKLNLKIKINESYIEKSANIITMDSYEEYYEILDSSPEELDHIISVDGSAHESEIGAGIMFRYEKDGIIDDREAYYCRIKSVHANLRNIAGEIYATIYALRLASEKGWKVINLIFDYIGLPLYVKGVWKSKETLINKYHDIFWEIINKQKITVNWYKAYSHTSIRINDCADVLSKAGAGLVAPPPNSIELEYKDL